MTTYEDVARWMVQRIRSTNGAAQIDIADELLEEFGSEFVDETDAGNLSINGRVRSLLQTIDPGIEWVRSERAWLILTDETIT